MSYVELHCHSNYSFHNGASFIHELLGKASSLGYSSLAITDNDNLCGAMEFSRTAISMGIRPIIGAEITLTDGYHVTILAENKYGYRNLCRLISMAKMSGEGQYSELDARLLSRYGQGLILLTGCLNGKVPWLAQHGQMGEAEEVARWYVELLGKENVYLELQYNLVHGDIQRNRNLMEISRKTGLDIVATNNVHYHIRQRHQLHDCLVSIGHRKTLEESHRERRANSEFYLKSHSEMVHLFREIPKAISNTALMAERCAGFDLARDLDYSFPEVLVPDGYTQQSYLRHICEKAAVKIYGGLGDKVVRRLDEEFRLITRHNLAGFFLIYHDIIQVAREVMVDLGLTNREVPIEENPPGRGRGSSVSMLVGYLIGLSHIDPLEFNLSLERFLPDDEMVSVPDIDLDFPRNIREELIKRIHKRYGWDHAVLTGMIVTYKLKSAVKDLGLALGLPKDRVERLARRSDNLRSDSLRDEMSESNEFHGLIDTPAWKKLSELVGEVEGFPRYLAQHPGGMVIGSKPLTSLVPVQPAAIDGRYIMHWDKTSISDAGFVKIDFLALGALSQIQEALGLIESRFQFRPDLSRIDFEDSSVYDMLCNGDTIGIFQVESSAQIQTITRIRPRNLIDMAREVAAVRPGVGLNDGITEFIARRNGEKPEIYDHYLERRSLERTLGVILFQDQVNQLAVDVANLSPLEADQLRRAYGRNNNKEIIKAYWEQFRDGAVSNGVDEEIAGKIFSKFNGYYMFPESHAFAFGVTAYQVSWLKYYYPLEFYVSLFNQQPMGFYNLETLKEDAGRHGIRVIYPDINMSFGKCTIQDNALKLGFLSIDSIGPIGSKSIVDARERGGLFTSVLDFMERTALSHEQLCNIVDSGGFDKLTENRRMTRWGIGLSYKPISRQANLGLPVSQDMVDLPLQSNMDLVESEYRAMGLHPPRHVMAYLRDSLGSKISSSKDMLKLEDGARIVVVGLVIRRQRPQGKGVFITLEDEYGHTSIILWPKIYNKYSNILKEAFVVVYGTVSRRAGTLSIVASIVRPASILGIAPKAKNWV